MTDDPTDRESDELDDVRTAMYQQVGRALNNPGDPEHEAAMKMLAGMVDQGQSGGGHYLYHSVLDGVIQATGFHDGSRTDITDGMRAVLPYMASQWTAMVLGSLARRAPMLCGLLALEEGDDLDRLVTWDVDNEDPPYPPAPVAPLDHPVGLLQRFGIQLIEAAEEAIAHHVATPKPPTADDADDQG